MPDIVDIAQENWERMEELRRRAQPTLELEATGFCQWCGEPVADPKKFCDLDCSQDYEAHKRRALP